MFSPVSVSIILNFIFHCFVCGFLVVVVVVVVVLRGFALYSP